MNLKRGFRRITLVLAIVTGLCSSLVPLVAIVSAHDFVRRHERQLEYYKKKVETGKYSPLDVVEQEGRLEQARNNFWAKLSIIQAFATCVLTGIAGFCGVWLVYKLIEWLVLGFYVHTV